MAHTVEVKGGKLVITVDISSKALASAQPSKSGKTRIVASTHGFEKVNDDISVSLNVTTR